MGMVTLEILGVESFQSYLTDFVGKVPSLS